MYSSTFALQEMPDRTWLTLRSGTRRKETIPVSQVVFCFIRIQSIRFGDLPWYNKNCLFCEFLICQTLYLAYKSMQQSGSSFSMSSYVLVFDFGHFFLTFCFHY